MGRYIKVDSKKLASLVAKNGSKKDLSNSLGRDDSYIGKVIKRGSILYGDWLLIKQLYDVDIEYQEPIPEVKEVEQISFGLNPIITKDTLLTMSHSLDMIKHFSEVKDYILYGTTDFTEEETKQFIYIVNKALDKITSEVCL